MVEEGRGVTPAAIATARRLWIPVFASRNRDDTRGDGIENAAPSGAAFPTSVVASKGQTTPNASMASATFLKPAMFAPFT
jgi:hypothetical protein